MATFIYMLLFGLAAVSALLVVFSRHAVHSAIYLVVTMIAIAGIFIMIGSDFAAALQVLVYAGAIMVLFIFVIMLLNLRDAGAMAPETRNVRRIGALLSAALVIQGIVLAIRFGGRIEIAPAPERTIAISDVALALLTRYIYAFEMTSIVLLVAIVGSMVLARRSIADRAGRSGDSLG